MVSDPYPMGRGVPLRTHMIFMEDGTARQLVRVAPLVDIAAVDARVDEEENWLGEDSRVDEEEDEVEKEVGSGGQGGVESDAIWVRGYATGRKHTHFIESDTPGQVLRRIGLDETVYVEMKDEEEVESKAIHEMEKEVAEEDGAEDDEGVGEVMMQEVVEEKDIVGEVVNREVVEEEIVDEVEEEVKQLLNEMVTVVNDNAEKEDEKDLLWIEVEDMMQRKIVEGLIGILDKMMQDSEAIRVWRYVTGRKGTSGLVLRVDILDETVYVEMEDEEEEVESKAIDEMEKEVAKEDREKDGGVADEVMMQEGVVGKDMVGEVMEEEIVDEVEEKVKQLLYEMVTVVNYDVQKDEKYLLWIEVEDMVQREVIEGVIGILDKMMQDLRDWRAETETGVMDEEVVGGERGMVEIVEEVVERMVEEVAGSSEEDMEQEEERMEIYEGESRDE